ncbi:MAG: hypothetical protein ACREER_02695 [Alphaproteobacteria bacterium]
MIAAELGALRASTASADVVRVARDADLAAFARRVLALAADPEARRAIEDGSYPFRLAGAGTTDPPAAAGAHDATARTDTARIDTARIEGGVVTETSIGRLPRRVVKLVLADGVTVTPLAKDRARKLGITIERSQP